MKIFKSLQLLNNYCNGTMLTVSVSSYKINVGIENYQMNMNTRLSQ